ncbi:glyoxylate/hydroxypyruvate/2-ketogluconate reductase [Cupriavidus metallidurans]|jgi:glyoxylate/hydroxypyruvate/2-ketogluconate reductase|uniref:2-keto-D-gluconate reductase (Glyoxalate reductase) (2-ketoaldonate reductase) n=2 Tax=Burkholderiaceae TaxID=119060 RepID=Q1LKK3_CUPMC|nr:2-keto-D-gluconate reductase (glyoxalate reductase) (2-ketoaldonate reductase) [Cupriavidus metallidurans CH34]KWW37496.1 Glyoxylate/hydroxypyruvate reductase B [Cupriavidus metallidurans]
MTDMKPSILVTRAIFPDVIERLAQYFDVDDNQEDLVLDSGALRERLAGKVGVLANAADRIDGELVGALPQLRAVCNMAVGYNNLDLPALTAAGIVATNTPDVLTETTADFGWALLMATARRVTEGEHYLRAGKWERWSYDMLVGMDVQGSTLGILGMGRIGQGLARRAAGFDMQVLYHNRSQLPDDVERSLNARYVSKAELLQQSDHLILVLPYSVESHHAIGAAEIAQMKPTATLINLARGGIVDDAALAAALRARKIFAAGLDVFEGEPSVHPDLLTVPNVVLTPHIASASEKTRRAMANLAADNLIAALDVGPQAGKPPTVVNPEVMARRR